LQDGTFNLILCRRFEKENEGFMPNFPKKSFYPLSLGGLTTKVTQFCKMHNICFVHCAQRISRNPHLAFVSGKQRSAMNETTVK
jgi:hypothetical protein